MMSDGRSCLWSTKTAMEVTSCPVTKEQWDERARIKNCTSLAHVQNCTKSSNFKYHCVMNEFEDAFIEVCAPVYNINGYCAEYNTLGARIQLHYNLKCSDVEPQCADQYISTDAYLYKGCYDVIKQNQLKLSSVPQNVPLTTTVYKVSNKPVLPDSDLSKGLDTRAVIGLAVGVIILLCAGPTVFCVRYFRKRKFRRETREQYHEETTPLSQVNKDEVQSPGIDNQYLPKTSCKRGDFRYAIESGNTLREYVQKGETNINEKLEDNKNKTIAFLNAYNNGNKYFETQMTGNCSRQLEKTGLVILIGKQGCGKTLTAVHIMNNYRNEGWIVRKFSSWNDLLAFDLKRKTLVYIDNILDGYIYNHELQRWWDALCYIYFECINKKNSIRLLITAKDNVIEKACAHIDANIPALEKMFFVRADSNPLTLDEKIEIINMQMHIANELKKIPVNMITANLKNCIDKQNGPVGYPLCAHLYAFEERPCKKDTSIFDKPREHVRDQIAHEIEKGREDKHGVKTLFLVIMLYQSSDGSNRKDSLELIYKDECMKYLRKELLTEMEPLNFDNLNERAEELKENFLIKHGPMYEFKHKIYLEGAIDYFFREYFDVAVRYFPLDIIHAYEFRDMSEDRWLKLMQRLQNEILENEVSKALSCKIFDETEFEKMFCEKLRKENKIDTLIFIPDRSSTFELPIIFWAAKYGLEELSKLLWDFVKETKEEEEVQFYLARFGECCEKDESYIKHVTFPLNDKNLKAEVCRFRVADAKETNILHLLISSNKPDYDANHFLCKILLDASEQNISVDTHLLNLALTHTKRSRLLCILKIINQLEGEQNISLNKSTQCLIDPHYKAIWELEWTVRICIALVKNVGFNAFTTENIFVKELVDGKAKTQSDMSLKIYEAIEKCQTFMKSTCSSGNDLKTIDILLEAEFEAELKKAVRRSIEILSNWEAQA